MDIFYWPVMEILIWGFLSVYIDKLQLGGLNVVTVLLGAIVFWVLLDQSQKAVSIAFLEEVWEKNLLNIFVTPLTVSEFLTSTIFVGLIRIILAALVMIPLAFFLYSFNLFTLGLYLIPFVAILLLFGWTLGLFSTAVILRFGTSAQIFAWGFIVLIQPFSAVFYPVSALPKFLQPLAYMIPSTYVFEGMRHVIALGTLPLRDLAFGFGSTLFYAVLVVWFFATMFAQVKRTGRLLKLD
ncbi:MAG: ABC transporter permease [Patescibacteria group bacterium]